MELRDIEKLLDERLTRERVLNRIETHALTQGLKPEAVEDARSYLSREAQAGERLEDTPIAAHTEKLRSEKPHYFSAPARTSPAAKDAPAKGLNGSATDHKTSSKKDFSKFLLSYAGVRA